GELGQVDVAGGHELGRDRVALVLQELLVDRRQDLHLGEVLAADHDGALAASVTGVVALVERVVVAAPRGEEQGGRGQADGKGSWESQGATFCVPRARLARVRWAPCSVPAPPP